MLNLKGADGRHDAYMHADAKGGRIGTITRHKTSGLDVHGRDVLNLDITLSLPNETEVVVLKGGQAVAVLGSGYWFLKAAPGGRHARRSLLAWERLLSGTPSDVQKASVRPKATGRSPCSFSARSICFRTHIGSGAVGSIVNIESFSRKPAPPSYAASASVSAASVSAASVWPPGALACCVWSGGEAAV